MSNDALPIAVIGGGPIDLAAAARLAQRHLPFVVFEASDTVGAAVLEWGHVALFSPWRHVIDDSARALLEAHGWQMPDDVSFPTGREFVAHYLTPLAGTEPIASSLWTGARVTEVARLHRSPPDTAHDAITSVDAATSDTIPPTTSFLVRVEVDARVEHVAVRGVIDASGTWATPNPAGARGHPATGEAEAAPRISHGIPDVLGSLRRRFARRDVAVIGSGHSAQNVLRDLAALRDEEPGATIHWLVRRPDAALRIFGGGAADELPERGRLGTTARALVDDRKVELSVGFRTATIVRESGALAVVAEDGRRVGPLDEIVVATGFHPDFGMQRGLHLDVDPEVGSTSALAPMIDPRLHDCGSVAAHGERELRHPEPGLYIVGAKSYGRAPTFLLATGYEQVRSVVAALDGDVEAARAILLALPATGVCVTDASVQPPGGDAGAGCCGPVAPSAACCAAQRVASPSP